MSFVDFTQSTATQVFCLFRALNYEDPLRVKWNDKTVFIRSLFPLEDENNRPNNLPPTGEYAPGTVLYCKERKSLIIRCSDTWVYCNELQILPKSKNTEASVIQHDFSDNKQKFTVFDGYQ